MAAKGRLQGWAAILCFCAWAYFSFFFNQAVNYHRSGFFGLLLTDGTICSCRLRVSFLSSRTAVVAGYLACRQHENGNRHIVFVSYSYFYHFVQSESGLLNGFDKNLSTISLNNSGFEAGV